MPLFDNVSSFRAIQRPLGRMINGVYRSSFVLFVRHSSEPVISMCKMLTFCSRDFTSAGLVTEVSLNRQHRGAGIMSGTDFEFLKNILMMGYGTPGFNVGIASV